MRREPTDAERKLWGMLRNAQLGGRRFRRQHPIPPYIVDFACIEAGLVVEMDGGQHADSAYDAVRDRHLRSLGWQVLRFWNNEVLSNPDGVAQAILITPAPPAAPPGLRR